MDALGVILMGAGAFLVYGAYKGEHPWTLFTGALGSASSVATPGLGQSSVGNAGATGSAAIGSTASGVKVH